MAGEVRWGILGCGSIAHTFATGLAHADGARIVAAGSRSLDKARQFAAEFDIPRAHGSYEELAADEEVDVVYVATPHPMHCENSLLCLESGRAVLCEKPFAINAGEARRVVEAARHKRLFLMEAMWSRFLPSVRKAKELVAAGAIGDVRVLSVDFGFRTEFNPASRLLDPRLGGGALLDVGIYTVSLASLLFESQPSKIVTLAHIGETGVDEQSAMTFAYPDGALAQLTVAVRTNMPQEALIVGTEGSIKLHSQWWRGGRITLTKSDGKKQEIEEPLTGNGYNYEATEVVRCLRDGLLESPLMTLDETVAIIETLDTIRAQWGLTYPSEA